MSSMPVQVSIVIPVKNNLHFTRQCLASISAAPPDVSYQIIVVDNASEDGTREFLKEKSRIGELQFIRNNPPMPFAHSCNQGAELAQGKYIVFLNNDIEVFPGWLDALVNVAETEEQVGAVGAKLLFPDQTIQHAGVSFFHFNSMEKTVPFHIFRDFPRHAPAVNQQRDYQAVTGACMLTPRNVFQQAGGFDTHYVNCFEDVDYCLRLRQNSLRVIYTPDAELIHYESQTSGRNDHVRKSGAYLQKKWAGQLREDAQQYLEPEGFHVYEEENAQLMVCFGPVMAKWWKLIHQLIEMGQLGLAVQEIERLAGHVPGTPDLYETKAECYRQMKDEANHRKALKQAEYYREKRAAQDPFAVLRETPENQNADHMMIESPALEMNLSAAPTGPKVSIVIPVRNNLHYTRKCLASIAQSPPAVSYEIIVIDNASDDGTAEFLARKQEEDELTCITNDPPQPFAHSCNQGAHEAQGDYIVFLNNDIEAFPGWLDALVEVAERPEKIGAVGAKLLFPDNTIQHAGVAFHYFRKLKRYGPYHIFRKFDRHAPAVNKEREFQAITGACLLTPRDLFLSSGGFDEQFVNCFEDVDYCLRLHTAGYKIIYTPKAELIHYEGQTSGRKDAELDSFKILQDKWNDQMTADDIALVESEGFAVHEDSQGRITIYPGQELQQWWQVIDQLLQMGEYQLVLDEIDQLELIIGRNQQQTAESKGRCYLELGEYHSARAEYARALTFDPKGILPQWGLVQVAIAAGDTDDAAKRIKKLIADHPDHEDIGRWKAVQRDLSGPLPHKESEPLLEPDLRPALVLTDDRLKSE